MAWYRTGTVTVTNGSAVVTGSGTAFVENVRAGYGFVAPDGKTYEVLEVVSNTSLTLAINYLGASAAGQSYAIFPTQSVIADLATQAAELLASFATVRDGVGSGLHPDGTVAAPAIRFSADQDTGFYRIGANIIGIGTGGAERARVDGSGNLLVGVATSASYGAAHRICKDGASEGSYILSIDGDGGSFSGAFFSVISAGWNSSGAAMWLGANSSTMRSINAAGTVNASGADYAEYMTKADGCGTIAKGDVCGVDAEGKLTKTWAAALSFVVKSTDPAYVGGDRWSAPLGTRPMPPGEGASEAALAQFSAGAAAYDTALEALRQTVDRIAFAGQVPVNVEGAFAVGDYIVAAANGGGINAVAVAAEDITFEQYRRRVGKVWAIREGRAWIDVQHG